MNKMFRYDWSLFNTRLGLIFTISSLVVFNLMDRFDFQMMAAGISALLAWLTIILVPNRRRSQHIFGLAGYLVAGLALTWLAGMVEPYYWLKLASMALVTFAGYLMLLQGPHPYMVSWCLVYWYLLVPLFLGDNNVGPVMLAHAVGVCLVISLNLLKPLWSSATVVSASNMEPEAAQGQNQPTVRQVVGFASVVSLSMVTGLAAGIRFLTADPTLIANATLNMISPSLEQTWHAAVERIILGFIGIIGGFYFGWFFNDPWVGQMVIAVCSFLTLGVIYINFGLVIGVFFFLISYAWGGMQSDLAHRIANEKLLGEFVGVAIAVIAITLLTRLQKMTSPNECAPDICEHSD